MEHQPGNRIETVVLPAVIVAVFLLVIGLTARGGATTMDSLFYLEATENFTQGHGIAQTNFDLAAIDGYKPITMWPPLYPIALSPFALMSESTEMAAGYFNAAALCVALALFFLIARRLIAPTPAAVLALFFAIQPPILTIYTYAWSETLFIPLILMAYFAGLKYLDAGAPADKKSQIAWLALAAGMLGLAANTRYIGLAFLPGVLAMVWLAHRRISKAMLLHSALTVAIAILSLVPLFVRNLIYSGYFSGAERGRPPTHLVADFVTLGKVLALNFLHFPIYVSFAIALALIAFVAFLRVSARGRSTAKPAIVAEISLPLVWVATYLGALIVLRQLQTIDLDTRMISVIVPFVLFSIIGLAKYFMAFIPKPIALVPFLIWAGLQTMQGYETFDRAMLAWRSGQALLYATTTVAYVNLRNSPFTPVARAIYSEMRKTRGDFIIFNEWRPMLFKRLVDAKVKQVPLPLTENTRARINSLGGRNGVFWITSDEGMDELHRAYGTDLGSLKLVKEATQMGVTVVALPLPPLKNTK